MSDRGRLMWQVCACGGDDDPSEVEIAGSSVRVELFGLRRAFRQPLLRGVEPVGSTAEQLLTMIKAENRVPRSEEQAYKVALLREYALFCEKSNATESSLGGPSRTASQVVDSQPRREASEAPPQVEIFSKPTCPYTRGLRRRLERDQVPFVEYDVQSDPAKLKLMLELNGGQRHVPTVRRGDQVTVGFHGH